MKLREAGLNLGVLGFIHDGEICLDSNRFDVHDAIQFVVSLPIPDIWQSFCKGIF